MNTVTLTEQEFNTIKGILKALSGRPMMLKSMTDEQITWLYGEEFLTVWKESKYCEGEDE